MNKVFVLVLADIETKEALGRVVNAMQTAKEFKDAGDEVRLVFDGAGTRWIGELGSSGHKYHGLFASLKDRAGACSYCAAAFGVKSAVEPGGDSPRRIRRASQSQARRFRGVPGD